MRTRKLAVVSAAAALTLGGLGLIAGCHDNYHSGTRSDNGGMYRNDAGTAGSRSGTVAQIQTAGAMNLNKKHPVHQEEIANAGI